MKARGKTFTAPPAQVKAVLSALPSRLSRAGPASHLLRQTQSKQQRALLRSVTTFNVCNSTTNYAHLCLLQKSIPSPLSPHLALIVPIHLLRPTCLYSIQYRMRR